MLVGTIGIPRKEVLYELTLAEIILITRGYFARFRPSWEQARMIAYFARYAMGSKTTPPSIQEWFPLPWEKEQEPELTDEQVEEIRQRLIEENERNAKCQK